MRFVERKDLDKVKCNFCGSNGIYITKISFPLGINEDYDSGMRIRVCLCSKCLKSLHDMGITYY